MISNTIASSQFLLVWGASPQAWQRLGWRQLALLLANTRRQCGKAGSGWLGAAADCRGTRDASPAEFRSPSLLVRFYTTKTFLRKRVDLPDLGDSVDVSLGTKTL